MSEFPFSVVEPCVTIHTYSLESIGPDINSMSINWLISTVSTVYPVANMALFIPFSLTKSITAVKMFTVTGAVNNGNIDVGIYDVSGARLVSNGSVAQAGAGGNIQEFDIADTRLGPGNFYLAVAMDGVIGTLYASSVFANIGPAIMGMAQMAAAFPLPATAVFAQITGNFIPVVGLTTRTVI